MVFWGRISARRWTLSAVAARRRWSCWMPTLPSPRLNLVLASSCRSSQSKSFQTQNQNTASKIDLLLELVGWRGSSANKGRCNQVNQNPFKPKIKIELAKSIDYSGSWGCEDHQGTKEDTTMVGGGGEGRATGQDSVTC